MENLHYKQFLSCRPKLYRFALSLTKDVNDAEDLFQETLLKLWELRSEWAEWKNFEAYAMRMQRNAFLNNVKKSNKQPHLQLDEISNHPFENATDINMRLADLRLQFYSLTSQLPAIQRDILYLREIEEMEYKEIGEVLNLTEAQVKVYLYRGRQYIKNKMNGTR